MNGKYNYSNGKQRERKKLDKILFPETVVENSGNGSTDGGNYCNTSDMGQG